MRLCPSEQLVRLAACVCCHVTYSQLVDGVVQSCPIDARRPLYSCVALTGGSSAIRRLGKRVQVSSAMHPLQHSCLAAHLLHALRRSDPCGSALTNYAERDITHCAYAVGNAWCKHITVKRGHLDVRRRSLRMCGRHDQGMLLSLVSML